MFFSFVVKRQHLLPLTFFSSKGNTISMSLRLEKRRALQLLPFDDKLFAVIAAHFLPLPLTPTKGSTQSTALRCFSGRALIPF